MEATKLIVELTVDQTNVILSALSKLPFENVVDLIHTIRTQAESQLNPPSTQEGE